MRAASGFTFGSLITQPLAITILAGVLNGAPPGNAAGRAPQEPAGDNAAGVASPKANGATAAQRKPEKLRKWSGNLVDADCMTNALRQIPSLDPSLDPFSAFWQSIESSQRDQQAHRSGAWSPQATPPALNQTAWSGDSDGEPELSERELAMQRAQLREAAVLEQSAKACAPNGPTTHYGLLVSSGELLRFDTAGNLKAKEAVNISAPEGIEPGRAVKASVTGMPERENWVIVASIKIKSRIPTPRVVVKSGSGQ